MTCPNCGKEVKYCEEVKMQSTKVGGILDMMFDINKSEYGKKYKCAECNHVEIKSNSND